MHLSEKKLTRELVVDLTPNSLDLGPLAFGLQDSFL